MQMTATETTPAPKKSNKALLLTIALIITLAANHFNWRVGYVTLGIDVTDSTIVITPTIDTIKVSASGIDSSKSDSTKK